MTDLREILADITAPPYLYFGIAAIILLAALYFLVYYRRQHRGIIPFKSEGGTIEIAPQTLRGVMQYAVNNVAGVVKADCQHIVRGQRIGVRVAIHLEANRPLRSVDAAIKDGIRRIVRDQFGIEDIDPIHIRVTKMVGEPRRSPEPETRMEERPLRVAPSGAKTADERSGGRPLGVAPSGAKTANGLPEGAFPSSMPSDEAKSDDPKP